MSSLSWKTRPRTAKTERTPSSNPVPADVLTTLSVLGIDVEKVQSDEAWALCPNPKHDDHKASWSVNLDTGAHMCFSCGYGGPFIRLVRDYMDLDNEHAGAWVRARGGIEVAARKLRGERFQKKQAEEITEADLALFEDPPAWALNDKDVDLESCHAYGVLWDPKRENWIFPVRDPYSNVLKGWQAKGRGIFLNYPDHLEKSTTVFGYHLLDGLDTAYLEESPVDCLRLHTYSVDGAVSGYGVHVSDAQMRLLADKVDNLVVCLDNDEAGRKKEAEIWREWRHAFRGLYFANYTDITAKDHGEMSVPEIEFTLTNKVSSLRYRP